MMVVTQEYRCSSTLRIALLEKPVGKQAAQQGIVLVDRRGNTRILGLIGLRGRSDRHNHYPRALEDFAQRLQVGAEGSRLYVANATRNNQPRIEALDQTMDGTTDHRWQTQKDGQFGFLDSTRIAVDDAHLEHDDIGLYRGVIVPGQ